jgi:hypothetical protein
VPFWHRFEMPPRLTLQTLSKLARSKDPATWDSLSPAERQKMLEDLQHQKNLAAVDKIQELLRKAAKR